MQTAEILKKFVTKIEQVNDLVSEISIASQEQQCWKNQLRSGSTEQWFNRTLLNSQARQLHELMNGFNLSTSQMSMNSDRKIHIQQRDPVEMRENGPMDSNTRRIFDLDKMSIKGHLYENWIMISLRRRITSWQYIEELIMCGSARNGRHRNSQNGCED